MTDDTSTSKAIRVRRLSPLRRQMWFVEGPRHGAHEMLTPDILEIKVLMRVEPASPAWPAGIAAPQYQVGCYARRDDTEFLDWQGWR